MKYGKQFGLFLEIRVDQENQVAISPGQARHHRLVMTEIAGQVDDRYTGILTEQRQRNIERCVGRTVVDEHDLEVIGERRGGGRNASVKLFEVRSRPVQRADDGKPHSQKLNM